MKPAPFRLLRPVSAEEAVSLARELGDEAKVLAGGQSLLPMMNLRLVRPECLLDLNRVDDFPDLSRLADGTLRIGPLTRHYELEQFAGLHGVAGYLGSVAPSIAHLPVRLRGTVAGSLAHADPASEWCAALLAARASVVARSAGGSRNMPLQDFLQGSFTTALEPDELVVEILVPEINSGSGLGFAEVSRRPGDFALALAAVGLDIVDGQITDARVVVGAVTGGISRLNSAEDAMRGMPVGQSVLDHGAAIAAGSAEVYDDVHSSVLHRRQLVRTVVRRALADAVAGATRTPLAELPR